MDERVSLRPAAPADAAALVRAVADGMEHYRAFAPAGWAPQPPTDEEVAHLGQRLRDPDIWCLLAEDETGDVVGQVTVLPAVKAARPAGEPGLAHLANLFVAERAWGTGLATALHRRAVSEAARRGFSALRLFVAAGHARARRFYDREGWAPAGSVFFEPRQGLDLVEYRRPTTGRGTDRPPRRRR